MASPAPPPVADLLADLATLIEVPPDLPGLLADYLATATGVAVSPETVRRALHAAGYVCKRPTWTLKRKAEEQAEYPGNARGWRRSSRWHRPPLHPCAISSPIWRP